MPSDSTSDYSVVPIYVLILYLFLMNPEGFAEE